MWYNMTDCEHENILALRNSWLNLTQSGKAEHIYIGGGQGENSPHPVSKNEQFDLIKEMAKQGAYPRAVNRGGSSVEVNYVEGERSSRRGISVSTSICGTSKMGKRHMYLYIPYGKITFVDGDKLPPPPPRKVKGGLSPLFYTTVRKRAIALGPVHLRGQRKCIHVIVDGPAYASQKYARTPN